LKEIFTNLSLISIILTSISSIAAVFTVYFSYKSIKVNRELFDKTQKVEEQRLLPLFDINSNYNSLQQTDHFVKNPNPNEIVSVGFINLNYSPVANIRLRDGVVYNNSDKESLLTSKYIQAYNHGTKGLMLNFFKNKLKVNKIKINITYTILTNKMFMTEIILTVSDFEDVLYFSVKEQNQIEVTNSKKF